MEQRLAPLLLGLNTSFVVWCVSGLEFGQSYARLAEKLGGNGHSLLTPDLGGVLFHADHLRIYDLVGLCDRTVARTLMHDTQAFHDYVFESARPTFIHVHRPWADWAALHGDPRFARDYRPLWEVWKEPGRRATPGDEDPGEPAFGDYVAPRSWPTIPTRSTGCAPSSVAWD